MRLMMSERRLLVKVEAERYRTARKKEKGRILDELVALSGYNRWYAVGLLRGHGKAIKVGRRLRLVGDLGRSTKRRRPRIYDDVVLEWLKKIWAILDFVCGKRLAAILPKVVPVLEQRRRKDAKQGRYKPILNCSGNFLTMSRVESQRQPVCSNHRFDPPVMKRTSHDL